MKPVSGKAFCKILERNGWVLERVSGAHFIYKKPDQPKLSVPVHGHRDLRPGTQRKLMRQAGLTDDDL